MKFDIKKLLSGIFVSDYNCIICDRELKCKTRFAMCVNCFQKQETVTRPCLKCGKNLLTEEEYCLDCQNSEKAFDRALAPFVYAGAIPGLVMNLKFHGKRYLAPYMARFMIDLFLEKELTASLVIPVPLHKNREKLRGFNQSALIGEEVARGLGLPCLPAVSSRCKDTLASSSLEGGRKAREQNVKDAFVINEPSAVKNKTVLVIDDVFTTGATSAELARVLKKAGAARVYVLTFATTKELPPLQNESSQGLTDILTGVK